MLRRGHLVIGITAVVAFVLSGQLLGHHRPAMEQLPAEMRMMYISRHIYLLTGALVNAVLGLVVTHSHKMSHYPRPLPPTSAFRLAAHSAGDWFHFHSDFRFLLVHGVPHRAAPRP